MEWGWARENEEAMVRGAAPLGLGCGLSAAGLVPQLLPQEPLLLVLYWNLCFVARKRVCRCF